MARGILGDPNLYMIPAACLPQLDHGLPRGQVSRPALEYRVASETHPLVGHYDRVEDAARAEALLAALEHAWTVQIDSLGYREPLPDGVDGPELDFYLVDQHPLDAWTAADAWVDTSLGDGASSTPAYIVFSRDLPSEHIETYAAHEFNHITQWATDFSEPSIHVWEATATASQHWTLGDAGAWAADVDAFQAVPGAPVLFGEGARIEAETGTSGLYEYGAALWVLSLAASGAGASEGPALWEALASEGDWSSDVLNALQARTGDVDGFLDQVAIDRLNVGPDAIAPALPGATSWGPDRQVPIEQLETDATLEAVWEPDGVRVTGQAFARVDVAGERLDLTLESSDPHGLVAILLPEWTAITNTSAASIDVSQAESVLLALTHRPGDAPVERPWPISDARVTVRFDVGRTCGCGPPTNTGPWWGVCLLFPCLLRRRER